MAGRSTTPRGRVRTRAGRRRSNSSPEPLRPQDRAGETPLESEDGTVAVLRRRGKPERVAGESLRCPGRRAVTEGEGDVALPAFLLCPSTVADPRGPPVSQQ